jgi:hypothetical protein
MSEKVVTLPVIRIERSANGKPAVTIAVPLDRRTWAAVKRRAREWKMDEADTAAELIRRGLK